jgi:2-amino-4-hydroxy-6-hydroxymethyldihydropteridine diphosphokinase
MKTAFVALGSNLGVPDAQLQSAVAAIKQMALCKNVTLSKWYKSKAIGGPDNQPDYINAVCRLETNLTPFQLLKALQNVEQLAGRTREVRWGPRTLDLDIIWYENFTSNTSTLTVPHPRAHERAFVLKPLSDLDASFLLVGKPLNYWLEQTADQVIQPHQASL